MIFILLITGTLNATSTSISNIGFLSISIMLVIANFNWFIQALKSKEINKSLLYILIISSLFVSISVISSLDNLTSRGIINILQFCLCIGFTVFLSTIKWDSFKFKSLGNLSSIFIVVNFIYWAALGFPNLFASIYSNSNQLGPYMLFLLFFVILARQHSKTKFLYNIVFIIGLLLIYGSSARSVWIAGIFAFITFISWKFIIKSKIRFCFFITSVLAALLAFIFIYPKLPQWDHFGTLQSIVWQLTDKNVMSGRSDVWFFLTSIIDESPWFGYGSGSLPINFTDFTASAHNLYLQIALQNGYLGLFVFMLLLAVIWMTFWKNRNDKIVKLTGVFFIAILIHQSFEIALTQNQLSVGLIQWLIIAIGLSQSINFHKSHVER